MSRLNSKTNTYQQLAKVIDHSLLRPELTEADLLAGCELAARYHVETVCVTRSGATATATILEGFKRMNEGTPLTASNSEAVSGNY